MDTTCGSEIECFSLSDRDCYLGSFLKWVLKEKARYN